MSTIKLPAASGGGSISIKGPASSGSDVDLLDTSGNLTISGQATVAGLVGVGTTSPTVAYGVDKSLHIHSTLSSGQRGAGIHLTTNASGSASGDGARIAQVDSDLMVYNHEDGLLLLGINGNETVRVDDSAITFKAPDGGNRYYFGEMGDSASAELSLYDSSDAQKCKISADSSETSFFNSGGGLCIGVTSVHNTGKAFSITGADHLMEIQNTSTAGHRTMTLRHSRADGSTYAEHIVFEETGGGAVGSIQSHGSSTAYNTSSDYRLKENISPISDGITRLKTLKPSRFNFKIDKDTTVDGFLAHEVTAVPEAITGTKDKVDEDDKPIYQQIDQSKLVPLLTAALQEAIAKIEILETKVAALEAS